MVLPEVVSIDHSNTYLVSLNTLAVYFGDNVFDECGFFFSAGYSNRRPHSTCPGGRWSDSPPL